jgi:hypothetical protein
MLRSEKTPWQSVVVFFARGLSPVSCPGFLSFSLEEQIIPLVHLE